MACSKIVSVLSVCIVLTLTFHSTTAFRKESFKYISVTKEYASQLYDLQSYLKNLTEGFQPIVGDEYYIMIKPENFQKVSDVLNEGGIKFEDVTENLKGTFKGYNRRKKNSRMNEITCQGFTADDLFSKAEGGTLEKVVYKSALRYCDIVAWLKEMGNKYRELMRVEEMGKTHEGRNIMVVKINEGLDREVVVLEGGSQARDWASITAGLAFIAKLVEELKTNATSIFNDYSFYIIPVLNPDGYEYTHLKDKLWKKNRAPTNTEGCVGTNLDRNFDTNWDYCRKSKASVSACTVKGNAPESEMETIAAARLLLPLKGRVMVFISLHAYGNHWLIPSSYNHITSNHENSATEVAMAVLWESLHPDHSVENLDTPVYRACGSFMDWMVEKVEVPYAYTLELITENLSSIEKTEIDIHGETVFKAVESALRKVESLETNTRSKRDRLAVVVKGSNEDGSRDWSSLIYPGKMVIVMSRKRHIYGTETIATDIHILNLRDLLNAPNASISYDDFFHLNDNYFDYN